MTRLADIQARVASMDELLGIVGALRSLAGMRMQEAQRALPGIRSYANSLAATIGSALRLLPERVTAGHNAQGQRAIVLCASEHGFVGGFNERLFEAVGVLDRSDLLFVLGSRGVALSVEHGQEAAWTIPMPTRLGAAPTTVNRLVAELYDRIARGEITRVEAVFIRTLQTGSMIVEHRAILPIDTAPLTATQVRLPPLHNLPPSALLERLMTEYVFALLTEATIESLASENAARFAAMDSAHDNVSKKLADLRQSAGQAQQTEITEELLDLVTGAEALGPENH